MKQIELLAPAKNLETGMAAINCGADAVYIGAPLFGAREAAGNPLSEIEDLVKYAHRYWARVYVTINTLLMDDELPTAVKLIHQLHESGVDAIIIQDVGLLECDLPAIPLFASTQMHNYSLEKIQFLEKVGISRAILARELSLDEIKEIRAHTAMELETFIHGALCVSFSGQCYASYAIGRRSANRGQCAQPCRRKYDLLDDEGKILQKNRHLLSLKDLNLSGQLSALCQAGVNSFKIEGRLKDRSYVMNMVSYYRQELDRIFPNTNLQPASSGKSHPDFVPNPLKTFNRGYTTYFIQGRDLDMGSFDTPKSVGEPIGRVISTRKNDFSVDSPVPLHNGDGICFLNDQSELCGTLINQVDGTKITPKKMDGIHPGVFLFRNYDHLFINQLNKSRTERKISLSFVLNYDSGFLKLTATDENGITALAQVEYAPQPAGNPELALENITKQLVKLGNTQFSAAAVEIHLPQPFFIPFSTLNEMRRMVIDTLILNRQINFPVPAHVHIPNDFPFPEKNLDFSGNVLNEKARSFYQRHGVQSISPAAESGLDLIGQKIMTTRYCIKFQAGLCHRFQKEAPHIGNLIMVDEDGRLYPLKFDCVHCMMAVYFEKRND